MGAKSVEASMWKRKNINIPLDGNQLKLKTYYDI